MGAIFLAVGLGLVVLWFVVRNKAKASQSWPAAQGRVLSSELARIRDTDGTFTEQPRIVYEYAVAGTSFQSTRVSFGGASNIGARKCVERYPAGATVQVFYDPAKPASAVLERKANKGIILLPLLGAFLLIAGILLLKMH